MALSKGLVVLLILGIFGTSLGHNWFSNPVSRKDQKDTQTGCRYGNSAKRSELGTRQAPTCSGPCDDVVANIQSSRIQTAARGQTVTLNWNTHTHPGGFVRFAWSPTSQSDAHSSFDSRVDKYVCKEIGGCSVTGSTAGGWSNAPTGVSECGISYTIPDWISDGKWTLQWAYFGGWLNAGDYYACVDYQISGGDSLGSQSTPVFQGGDYTYPGQDKCRFYTTQALHTCTVEPCTNGTLGTAGMESSGPPKVYTSSGALVDIDDAQALPNSTGMTPCSQDSDCSSGVCQIDGYCQSKSSSLDAGGIAAIVFAALVAILIVGVILFFVLNKSEVPYMRPFKGRLG